IYTGIRLISKNRERYESARDSSDCIVQGHSSAGTDASQEYGLSRFRGKSHTACPAHHPERIRVRERRTSTRRAGGTSCVSYVSCSEKPPTSRRCDITQAW